MAQFGIVLSVWPVLNNQKAILLLNLNRISIVPSVEEIFIFFIFIFFYKLSTPLYSGF